MVRLSYTRIQFGTYNICVLLHEVLAVPVSKMLVAPSLLTLISRGKLLSELFFTNSTSLTAVVVYEYRDLQLNLQVPL